MPDYATMYRHLFNSQTDAISLLQAAQIETEKMFIESEPPEIHLSPPQEGAKGDDCGKKE